MPSSFAPNEQTVISKRTPLPATIETLPQNRPAEIGKSLEGQRLGQFMLEEFVGGGGMGAVFRAVDTTLDRIVAVKVVSNEQTDEDTLRRFRNEAQSAARLDHPNIARVYSVGEEGGWNYIVFEFIEGVNVRDLVMHKGPLPLDEAISYTIQVADALEHASHRDVVHRDIKPSNLLVMEDGRAKLVDMGLARLHQVESSNEDLTATGVTLGTFDYISPEQARDPRDTDVRSDLYSLGCTFYYMLTGMPPFPEGTVLQKLLSHNSEEAPDPRDLRADLPAEISPILLKLMAKLPSKRYQRPSELTAELMALCEKLGLVAPNRRSAYSPAPRGRFHDFSHHLPWLVPLVLLLIIVFGVDAMLPHSATVERAALMPPVLPDAIDPAPSSPTPIPEAVDTAPAPSPPSEASIRPLSNPAMAVDTTPPVTSDTNQIPVPTPTTDAPKAPPPATSPKAVGIAAAESPAATTPVESVADTAATLPKSEGSTTTEVVVPPSVPSPASATPGNVAAERLVVWPEGPTAADSMVVRSLEEAVRKLRDQPGIRVIELRFNRYDAKPLTLDLRNDLTIEAGVGYQPFIIFDRQQASSLDDKRMIHLLGGRLAIRGVHFQVKLPHATDESWTLFHLNQTPEIALSDSTLTIQNDYRASAAFFHVQGPRHSEMPMPGADTVTFRKPNIILDACIARGEATLVRATDGLPFVLEFTQGLLATSERMLEIGQRVESVPAEVAKVLLRHVTAEMELGMCRVTVRDARARLPQLYFDSENSLLDHHASASLIEHLGIRDVAATMGHALEFTGTLNAYPRTDILWRLQPSEGAAVEVPWSERLDDAYSWYKEKLSESYAPWRDVNRSATRVVHRVTPHDYLVDDDEALGFDIESLPKLPDDDRLDDFGD